MSLSLYHAARNKSGDMILSLIAIIVVFFNFSQIFPDRSFVSLPIVKYIADHFTSFGVFTQDPNTNEKLVVLGLPEASRDDLPLSNWNQLNLTYYLPLKSTKLVLYLRAERHRKIGGQTYQAHAWKFLLQKIKEKHNREFSKHKVKKLAIQRWRWPRSKDGYAAMKRPPYLVKQLVYVEE